jgi:hypothetical protein
MGYKVIGLWGYVLCDKKISLVMKTCNPQGVLAKVDWLWGYARSIAARLQQKLRRIDTT